MLPTQLDAEGVADLVDAHPGWWATAGYAVPPGRPQVRLLGRGESCVVWSVEPGLAVRVPHRPVHELPLSLEAELDLLARVPDGLAARPVAARTPTEDDPTAYLVSSLVPGEVLAPAAWTDALLAALARTLARLHVGGRTDGLPAPGTPDPVAAAHAARDWWREHEPGAATVLEPLWPAVLRRMEQALPAFASAEPALVHGDACLSNVVVDGGVPRLIDWEWGHVGDPARDLAFGGGPLHADPWYAALTGRQVRAQARAYADERERLGAPVDLGPLLVRREVHLLHETYFIRPHLHRVAAAATDPGRRATYLEAAAQLRDGLERWLG
ncbi:phosphotransferase family protein [Serinicoccus sediminis]|uniref:phosphotransferase family protein n=1 Tax=Serinicoccus sediminis TaxID=2306021 RepID=UPI0013EC1DB6|nr:phosphotransferase [Serinicoccus sediminis]